MFAKTKEDATACCSQGKATCKARSKYVHGIWGFSTLESLNVTHFLWDTSLPTNLGLEPKIMDERESKNLKESTLCILHLWLPCFEFASGWKVTLGKINFGKSILFLYIFVLKYYGKSFNFWSILLSVNGSTSILERLVTDHLTC